MKSEDLLSFGERTGMGRRAVDSIFVVVFRVILGCSVGGIGSNPTIRASHLDSYFVEWLVENRVGFQLRTRRRSKEDSYNYCLLGFPPFWNGMERWGVFNRTNWAFPRLPTYYIHYLSLPSSYYAHLFIIFKNKLIKIAK